MQNGGLSWVVMQLADSGFPVGGFAHSAGLETAMQEGEVADETELYWFCSESIRQVGYAGLPFVNGAYEDGASLSELDAVCDAFLSNHVANRASRHQGRAFLSACERSFELEELSALKAAVRGEKLCQHFAPLFGTIARALRLPVEDARQLFLFTSIRGIISAAVRLNLIGPYAGQRLQVKLIPQLDRVLDQTVHLRGDSAAQTSPLLDVFQMGHDRLYSRLFQS